MKNSFGTIIKIWIKLKGNNYSTHFSLFLEFKFNFMINKYLIILLFLFGASPYASSQSKGFQEIKNLEIIDLIYQNLDKYFVEEPNIGGITKAGIDAMLEQLDPYTVYYPQSDIENYRLMTTGQYGGIGALIRKDSNYVVIAEPYKNMPADKAGLRAGDIILSINGNTMKKKNTSIVSEALKGPKETTVTIKYKRPNKGIQSVKVERAEIKMPDIPFYGMVDKKNHIGYIKLRAFTRTASKSVIDAFNELKNKGMKKLIFDLRGNGGGLLMEAINIVNVFVPQHTTIVKTKGRMADQNRTYKTAHVAMDTIIPVTVLVNGGSASASEIVSGSLQDLDRGVIIGTNTFGKGLVQRTVNLKYGAKMKLTIAKYYTPSGRCVQKLNYHHNGNVDEVPDSLIEIYHTRNGREVISGRGVYPDVEIDNGDMARVTAVLLGKNIIFNFATQFYQNHSKIAPAKTYRVSDETYQSFKDYVKQQHFKYTSATEKQLEILLEIAKKEGYAERIQSQYDALHKVLDLSTLEDMDLFEQQIRDLLTNEIVSRYYYQKGRVVNAFQEDLQFQKSIDILNNQEQYQSILQPKK